MSPTAAPRSVAAAHASVSAPDAVLRRCQGSAPAVSDQCLRSGEGRRVADQGRVKKGSDGIWADATGKKLSTAILGWTVFADVGPVVAAMLKKAGVDASYSQPPDAGDRQSKGDFTTFLSGHGGSVRDPYDTLHLYQSESVAVPGSHQVNFSRWVNKDFDAAVDKVYKTPMENTGKLTSLFHDAMQIWLPQLPDAQIDEWYHRIR